MATRGIAKLIIITRIKTVKWNKHFISCSNKQKKNVLVRIASGFDRTCKRG
jgi:hypothetical protein